jgi:hypothetical protein
MLKTIEIDCPPGNPRPGDLITEVVRGTLLEHDDCARPDRAVSKLFGCWTWSFPHITDENWVRIQEVTRPRIEKLYHDCVIRYGSW